MRRGQRAAACGRCLCAAGLLLLAGGPAASRAAESFVTPERPAELLVYQYPATDLVIRIDIPEAEFGARVLDPERAPINSSAVAGRRLGPVYLYIDGADLPRQLTIEVTPRRPVVRSAVGLELLPFAPGDRNAAVLARAYRLYASGVETARSEDAATWATKVYSLRNAARQFAELGREEMRLWSEYFAAHLILHELDDTLLASEFAREIRQDAARAGFADLELATLVLESEAMLRQLGVGAQASQPPASLPAGDVERAHEVLREIATRSGSAGLYSEQGRARYRDGLLLERQGETERALAQYQAALEAIAAANDPELLNAVRTTAAAAYESLGSTAGALALLDGSEGGPAGQAAQAAALERAARLYERGRLLNQTYRYAEAAEALGEALDLQRANASDGQWGAAALELAWSYHSMGRTDEALGEIRAALPRTPRPGDSAMLARAWGSRADILRARGRHDEAAQARERQLELAAADGGQALPAALFEHAMDARQPGAAGPGEARERLRRSRQAAAAAGDEMTDARSQVQLCLLELEGDPAAPCQEGAAAAAMRLRESGVPRIAVEAGFAQSRLLARTGQTAAAGGAMEATLDEIEWYRRSLPGVLGAWYALHADDCVRTWLALSGAGAGEDAAVRLLLALDRVRRFDADTGGPSPLDAGREESLRGLLARREAAGGEEGRRLAAEVNRELAAARSACPGCDASRGRLDAAGLGALLDSLDRSEAVLAYYLGADEAWAVLARRGGARRFQLADGPEQAGRMRDRADDLREGLAGAGLGASRAELDALGRLLLGPLPDEGLRQIYLLATGPLLALPFDALRRDGRYLAQEAAVVNLATLESLQRRRPALPGAFRERVFVAGNPQSQRDPFRFELRSTPEIATVTGRYVGPGLHVVQGVALGRDEFADPRFPAAALLHLAIPGVLDPARPGQSRLLLSADADAPLAGADTRLTPADVRAFRLNAALAALTGTAVANSGGPAHSGRLPLVSDFLDAGAGAVLYTLWPPAEAAAAAFAEALYQRLDSDPDIGRAVAAARQSAFAPDGPTNLADWAGFQLFIR